MYITNSDMLKLLTLTAESTQRDSEQEGRSLLMLTPSVGVSVYCHHDEPWQQNAGQATRCLYWSVLHCCLIGCIRKLQVTNEQVPHRDRFDS